MRLKQHAPRIKWRANINWLNLKYRLKILLTEVFSFPYLLSLIKYINWQRTVWLTMLWDIKVIKVYVILIYLFLKSLIAYKTYDNVVMSSAIGLNLNILWPRVAEEKLPAIMQGKCICFINNICSTINLIYINRFYKDCTFPLKLRFGKCFIYINI